MTAIDLLERIRALGVKDAALLPVEALSFTPEFRRACEKNTCGRFGKCWVCPPACGEIETLIAEAKGFTTVVVYQTVFPLEDSFDIEGMLEAGVQHRRLTQSVLDLLESAGLARADFLLLSAGGCDLCPSCTYPQEPCRHPARALRSLEAYGVSVAAMAGRAGLRYMHGPNTVTYFGAVLLKG